MTLPSAGALGEALVGRSVHTYLWREIRIAGIENGAVVVEEVPGDERVQVGLDDLQAGLDRLEAEGEVVVTIDALGPWAAEIAAMLAEAEGAAYADAPARVAYWGG